jgi:hypothetical protein
VTGRLVCATVLGDVSDIISAIAWPLLIAAVIWFLRAPLRALADRVGTDARSVSIGAQGVSVDFGSSVEHVPAQDATALAGVRLPEQAPRVVDSAAMTMFAQLNVEQPAPYLLVDLGEGREWLTSRLYVFARLLRAMRGTRMLVFVETVSGIRGRFVGLAAPEAIRWALARSSPWLEADYAQAYAQATQGYRTPAGAGEPFVVDARGRLSQQVAHQIATGFVFAVQQTPPGAPAQPGTDWVVETRPDGLFVEHASWLDAGRLEDLAGEALRRFAYLQASPGDTAARSARDAVVVHGEDAVALVDEQHRFRGFVVDRRDVLERLAGTADAGEPSPAVT